MQTVEGVDVDCDAGLHFDADRRETGMAEERVG